MAIQASEISAILKDQIKNFGKEAEVAEVGRVLSVGDGIARVYGLDNVQAGEMVEFPGGIRGMLTVLAIQLTAKARSNPRHVQLPTVRHQALFHANRFTSLWRRV